MRLTLVAESGPFQILGIRHWKRYGRDHVVWTSKREVCQCLGGACEQVGPWDLEKHNRRTQKATSEGLTRIRGEVWAPER